MRTINDIIPPSKRHEAENIINDSEGSRPSASPKRQPSRFPYKTLTAVGIVILICLGALYYLSSAVVTVTPNTVSAAVQSSFTADSSTGNLPFQIVTTQKVASQSVASTGTKAISGSATGSITIYNTQPKVQPLITNTRFATASGLIFRIHKSVIVPAGTASKPGSVVATIYADAPGATYNVDPTSFTVPGLAGTPQASAVYGQSTVAITGGASGSVPVIDPALESTTKTALVNALAPELASAIQEQIPSGYTLLPGSATTTFQELIPAPSATTGQADVKEQGTITAVVFPNAALAKAVATSVAGLNYQGEPLTLASSSTLQLSAATFPSTSDKSFAFTLAGTASFVYSVDATQIAAAVAGKSRSAAETALGNYPEVNRAFIVLRPFWKSSFPQDPSAITIKVVNP